MSLDSNRVRWRVVVLQSASCPSNPTVFHQPMDANALVSLLTAPSNVQTTSSPGKKAYFNSCVTTIACLIEIVVEGEISLTLRQP